MSLLYFAYGSNMSLPRLRARIPAAAVVTSACLEGYALHWHKPGRDGSGKCDIVHQPGHEVYGVVYRIAAADKVILDRFEGLGAGYNDCQLELRDPDGAILNACSYQAVIRQEGLIPFSWYRYHALYGARQQSLPADYIAQISRIATTPDPDTERQARELAIYPSADLSSLD